MAISPSRPALGLPDTEKHGLPMPAELFAMIGENAPMLAMARPSRRHADVKKQSDVTWQWQSFHNPGRSDGLQLSHWHKTTPEEAKQRRQALEANTEGTGQQQDGAMDVEPVSEDHPFAKFNTTTNVYSYSSDEYVSHLRDESGNWSREETDYLFGLCHMYDLRWFVIKDRWNYGDESAETGESQPRKEASSTADRPAVGAMQEEGGPLPAGVLTATSASAKPEDEHMNITDTSEANNGEPAKPSVSDAQGPFAASAPAVQAEQTELSKPAERTIEEMKDRYYSVCRKLIRARPASDEAAKQTLLQSYAFDKDREAARKLHLRKLMERTPQQLAEEEFLYIESRRLEQQYSKISRDRDDLFRLLGGIGPQSTSALALNSPFLSAAARENAANAAGLSNKKRRRGELDMLEDPNNAGQKVTAAPQLPTTTPAQDAQYGITRFDASTPASSVTRPSGVYLRSSKPPQLKTSLAAKITATLAEQNISMRLAMPTRQNMEKLEALVVAITSLLECKKQVERAEYEVKVLNTRKEAAMRIEEEDRAIKAQEEEAEARKHKEREASGLASTADALTPARESSSAASSMQVDT